MHIKSVVLIFFVTVFSMSCGSFKQQALFNAPANQEMPESIENFYSLDIFSDNLNGEHWFTESSQSEVSIPFMNRKKNKKLGKKENWMKKKKECLSITGTQDVAYSGSGAMLWKWDKKAGDCPWLGMGFGWDGWQGKDMSQIIDKAAIQFKVRTVKGTLKSLPLAACLEDYSGSQVWIGFSPKCIEGGIITEEWSNVILPIAEFEWENAPNLDPYNIKQLIVQFEADGELYVDEIKVIPYDGGFNKRLKTSISNSVGIKIDGNSNEDEWANAQGIEFDSYRIKTVMDEENIYFLLNFLSNKPMRNPFTEGEIFNGDALEIAFSSNPDLQRKRKHYYTTDQHIGINLAEYANVWDWQSRAHLKEALVASEIKGDLHQFEIQIPLSSLNIDSFEKGRTYGIEFALDRSSDKEVRKDQFRWNSYDREGFHENPSLWGELVISK